MANQLAASRMNKVLSELQMKGDLFTRQMVMEKKRVDDLEEAIRQADEQIKKFRQQNKDGAVEVLNLHRFTKNEAHQRADGADPSKQAEINQQKLVANLENRLNKMLVRQSQSENHNRQLKSQIDSLRRKRMASNNVRKQLEDSLRDMQTKCTQVMERSCAASEMREKAVEQQNELVRANADEATKFSEEVDQLAEYIAAQNRRFEESIAAAAAHIKGNFDGGDDVEAVRGELSIEEETHLGELVRDLAKQVEVERESLHATEERIAVYRRSFDELLRVSGRSELTDVVQVYVKSEEETFSLFNYIQALNQETDWTLERHARLEEEIKKYEERLGEEEAQRAEAMADLQEKWRNAKEATEECSQAAQEAQRTLDRIAKKIQSLFFKIQCDQVYSSAGADKGRGGKSGGDKGGVSRTDSRLVAVAGQGVSESNILAYTELIEQRALEIIAEYTKRMNQREQRQMTPMLDPSKSLQMNLPGAPTNADMVKPPDVPADEEDDDENDDKWPISLEEMRRRTAEKLLKKQNTRPAAGGPGHGKKKTEVKFKGGHGRDGHHMKRDTTY